MSGKAGEIVVGGVLGNVLPGSLAKLFDGNGSGSDGSGQLPGLCAMRKVLGFVWLMSLPPLRYETVQTAFASKTHRENGREQLWWYNWT